MFANRAFQKNIINKQDVCPTESKWVMKNYSRNMYGKPVKVLQRYLLNGTFIFQYFYETLCRKEMGFSAFNHLKNSLVDDYNKGGKCKGINSQIWISKCNQKYSWIYAKVINRGIIGWDFIAVGSSCSCSISLPDHLTKNTTVTF